MSTYLQPYAQAHLGNDPSTGLAEVGFGPRMVAQAAFQRARNNWIARQHARRAGVISGYDYPADDGDHLGADDLQELAGIDAELAALDDDEDDDWDEIGARPERKLRRLKRKLKRAKNLVQRIKRRLSRVLPFRKRKRARLEEKLADARAKVDEIKDELAEATGRAASAPAVRPATPQETRMVTKGQIVSPGAAMNTGGVFAGAPGPGQQVELPITFDQTGTELWEATIAAATTAGTQAAFSGETPAKTYLELQVVGLKVQCFLRAPLMTDGGATPLGVAIVEQSAQCSVVMSNATVDGGLNMLPDNQIMNVGGPFGLSSEKLFDGLRLQDVIFENGRCNVSGFLEVAFDAAQEYDIAMRAAVIAVITRDKRLKRG